MRVYGLAVGISDINNDGLSVVIYVSNDFQKMIICTNIRVNGNFKDANALSMGITHLQWNDMVLTSIMTLQEYNPL